MRDIGIAMRTLLIVLLGICTAFTAIAATPDCKFPSRSSKKGFVWVNAGQGGNWKKSAPRFGSAEGYFRFIYYRRSPTQKPRLFIEAWEHMLVGQDPFVGCIEITDERVREAKFVSDFSFRPIESGAESTTLDMKLYEGGFGSGKPYSVRVPFGFINQVY